MKPVCIKFFFALKKIIRIGVCIIPCYINEELITIQHNTVPHVIFPLGSPLV